jgi:ribosomal protein L7/L12
MSERLHDERLAVILPDLSGLPLEEVRDKLAKTFSILKSIAATIIQSAPIVLLEDASAAEARFLNEEIGIQLITKPVSSLNGTMPKLSWSERPSFDIRRTESMGQASGEGEFGQMLYVENNAGMRQIVFEEAEGAASGAAPAQTATATETAPLPAAADTPRDALKTKPDRKAVFGGRSDSNDIFVYNIFISKVTSEGKRQRAIELISKVRGISTLEAEELMKRTIVPIIKGVTKAEADEIQKMFTESRIAVQVLKKKK